MGCLVVLDWPTCTTPVDSMQLKSEMRRMLSFFNRDCRTALRSSFRHPAQVNRIFVWSAHYAPRSTHGLLRWHVSQHATPRCMFIMELVLGPRKRRRGAFIHRCQLVQSPVTCCTLNASSRLRSLTSSDSLQHPVWPFVVTCSVSLADFRTVQRGVGTND